MVRRASSHNTHRIDHIFDRIRLHRGDVADASSMMQIISDVMPEVVFNLAAMSQVRDSFETPLSTHDIVHGGAVNVFEACARVCPEAVIYQASSSEMYGNVGATNEDGERLVSMPINEDTPMRPCSPYGIAKTAAHHAANMYREAYGLCIVCGILFNHESERRGPTFVTQKIAKAVAEIAAGRREPLLLGNLSAERDWGYAPEYMEAAVRMVEKGRPKDYVIATGSSYTVEQFLLQSFRCAGIWDNEVDKYVEVSPRLKRPFELKVLLGDASKARDELGWKPKVTFTQLVERMVKHQMDKLGDVR